MLKKRWFRFFVIGLVVVGVGLFLSPISKPLSQTKSEYPPGYPGLEKLDPFKHKYVKGEYPEPRYPSYLKRPKTVEDVMPFARAAVRQIGGRSPLGLVNPGQTVLLITTPRSEEMLLQAIKKAYEERGVKVQFLSENEACGVSKEEAQELSDFKSYSDDNHIGLAEADRWFDKWDPKEAVVNWLKERRPDLYKSIYEKLERTERLAKIEDRLDRGNQAKGIIKYLDAHPEVTAMFWGTGGRTSHRRLLAHQEKKYYSSFIFDKQGMLMTRVPAFPGDLWRLIEERTIEPLSWLDRVHAWNPEGTDIQWDMSQEDAEKWARGVYQQGHLYMNPRQATGRFPYSVLEYPAMTDKWLAPVLTKANGVIGGCSNHAGRYEWTEMTVKDGYLTKVRGLGKYAETWEYVRANYPHMNDLTYPYYPGPGYFWLYEAGLGTNPKFILWRGDHAGERNHSGIIHWAVGTRLHHGPKEPFQPKEWGEFVKKNKLPDDHWMHIHNTLITYKVRVRGTDKWLPLIDKGRLTALDDPMVRALASRYGDPDDLLADEWRDHIPGINVPGNYADYAKKPRETLMEVFDQVENGTYKYFYTPPSMRKKK